MNEIEIYVIGAAFFGKFREERDKIKVGGNKKGQVFTCGIIIIIIIVIIIIYEALSSGCSCANIHPIRASHIKLSGSRRKTLLVLRNQGPSSESWLFLRA